uniref:Ig-like domain-containing protein n=1 Tax=Xiphophorus maculatus TaxID=8083 RepID=A0A3B5QZQ9_XIPMA
IAGFYPLNTDLSLSKDVHQDPPSMLSSPQSPATISCSHSISGYYMILWYQKPIGGSALKLIGYIHYTNTFQNLYNVTGSGQSLSSLVIPKLRQSEDSAVYFCAAILCSDSYPAYFGEGTKLTVLGKKKILIKEKIRERRKTLVCLASGFYPDHVSVFWQLNGQNVTDGVATDAAAKKNETTKMYSITSRLRLRAKTWFNPGNEFSCHITFFNGTNYKIYTTTVEPPGWWYKYSLTKVYIGEKLDLQRYFMISQIR